MKTPFILINLFVFPFVFAQNTNQDFAGFCTRFFKDSTYQMAHIKFPLTKVFNNSEKERYDTTQLSQSEWKYSDFGYFHNNYNTQVYDNFNKTFRDSKKRMLSFEGVENGIDVDLCFVLMGKEWILIRIEELSD
jgi:hypothetical protein